jgi:hypothetical protein
VSICAASHCTAVPVLAPLVKVCICLSLSLPHHHLSKRINLATFRPRASSRAAAQHARIRPTTRRDRHRLHH